MPDLSLPAQDRAFPELRDALTRRETWISALAFVAVLMIGARWPFLWEFSVLCFFPAGLFIYAAIRSGEIRKRPVARFVIIVAVMHCLLLAGTLYLWKSYPKIVNGDYAFGFVVIECAIIALLMRFPRPKRGGADVTNR